VSSAYIAFFSALALWAWHETTFLIGLLTGPRRVEASQAPLETSRFRAAFLTVRDHELALAATVMALAWFIAGAENTTGLLTFALMWVMRISTKLNIYLGARHAISEMLPDRLSYLKSYFRTDRTSGWFYVSLSASAMLLGWLSHAAATALSPNTTSPNGRSDGSVHDVTVWCSNDYLGWARTRSRDRSDAGRHRPVRRGRRAAPATSPAPTIIM
jgi:putative photosynthetic complex assembly protein 2